MKIYVHLVDIYKEVCARNAQNGKLKKKNFPLHSFLVSYPCLPSTYDYSPQQSVVQHSQFIFFHYWSKPSFHIHSNNRCLYRLISFTNFNAQFLYSLTICTLHYKLRHVSSINMPIFRRTNFINTASGIVTLFKRQYGMPDESRVL